MPEALKKLFASLRAKNINMDLLRKAMEDKVKDETLYFNFGAEDSKGIEDTEDENGARMVKIEGYASTKDRDRYNDEVEPTAFKSSLKNYLSKNPVFLLQHKPDKPIGTVVKGNIDENGLYIKTEVKNNIDDCMDHILNGTLRGFSIGFRVLKAEFVIEYGKEGDVEDWYYKIQDLELLEISLVSIPANPNTLINAEGKKYKEFTIFDSLNTFSKNFLEDVVQKGFIEEKKEDEVEETPAPVETPADPGAENTNTNDAPTDNANAGDEEKAKENIETKEDTPAGEETAPNEPAKTEEEKGVQTVLEKKTGEPSTESPTYKMLEDIAKKEVSKLRDAMKKEIEETYKKEFEKQLSEVLTALNSLVDFTKSVNEQNKNLLDRLKEVKSGGGVLFTKGTIETPKNNLYKAIEEAKKQL